MAELRATDIIGKLRKINDRIDKIDGTAEIPISNAVTTSYVRTPVININGYQNTRYTLSDLKNGSESNIVPWDYYEVLYDNSDIVARLAARDYIKYLTGSDALPEYSREVPLYHYIVTLDGDVYFPIFKRNSNLRIYKIPLKLKQEISNNITQDADKTDVAPSVKAIKGYVDSQTKKEVYIGSTQPTEDSYSIWIDIN